MNLMTYPSANDFVAAPGAPLMINVATMG